MAVPDFFGRGSKPAQGPRDAGRDEGADDEAEQDEEQPDPPERLMDGMDEHRLGRAVLHDGEVQREVVAKGGLHLLLREDNEAADREG
mgnify:CR=1 FL=1